VEYKSKRYEKLTVSIEAHPSKAVQAVRSKGGERLSGLVGGGKVGHK
jgi:hypothetical protein